MGTKRVSELEVVVAVGEGQVRILYDGKVLSAFVEDRDGTLIATCWASLNEIRKGKLIQQKLKSFQF